LKRVIGRATRAEQELFPAVHSTIPNGHQLGVPKATGVYFAKVALDGFRCQCYVSGLRQAFIRSGAARPFC
jgi:hypothetical protein